MLTFRVVSGSIKHRRTRSRPGLPNPERLDHGRNGRFGRGRFQQAFQLPFVGPQWSLREIDGRLLVHSDWVYRLTMFMARRAWRWTRLSLSSARGAVTRMVTARNTTDPVITGRRLARGLLVGAVVSMLVGVPSLTIVLEGVPPPHPTVGGTRGVHMPATSSIQLSAVQHESMSIGARGPGSPGSRTVESAHSLGSVVQSSIPAGDSPVAIGIDPTTGDIYVANNGSDNVTVINGSTNQVIVPSISVGSDPVAIAFDSLDGDIYVANNGSNNVTVISGLTNKVVVPSIPVGSGPSALAFDGDAGYMAVLNSASNNMTAIDGATNKGIGTLGWLESPTGVAFDSTAHHLYVSESSYDYVQVIEGGSKLPFNLYFDTVGKDPTSVVFDPSDSDVFVADSGWDAISVVDATTDTVVSTAVLPTPFLGGLGSMAADTLHGCVEVVYPESGWVSVVNDTTRSAGVFDNGVSRLLLGGQLGGIAFDPLNGDTYVADSQRNNVSVIRSGCAASPSIPTYGVTFNETGLTGGYDAEWRVRLGSHVGLPGAPSSSIVFSEPNGSYFFSIASVPTGPGSSWVPSPASGSLSVNASAVTINVSFSLERTHLLAFQEKHLRPGVSWSVVIGGMIETNVTEARGGSPSGSQGTIVFQLADGPVEFRVDPGPGYGVALMAGRDLRTLGSGAITGNTTWAVSFGQLTPLEFSESNQTRFQPYEAASWSVSLAQGNTLSGGDWGNLTTNGRSITFVEPAGSSVRFGVSGPGSLYKVVPASGKLQVPTTAVPLVKTLKFLLLTDKVRFKATGLSGRALWNVTIVTGSSPALTYPIYLTGSGSSTLSFRLPSGTYQWVASSPGYAATPPSGSLTISVPEGPATIQVEFT